jgi:thioesterase domain-containing protein
MASSPSDNVTVATALLFARASRGSDRVILPINKSAARADSELPEFYCVHSVSGAAGADFLDLAQRLDETVSFYGLQAPPRLMEDAQFGRSIGEVADHYIKELVKFRPEGRLTIGGYCIGAIIALDMARKLRAMGRQIGPVVVIDGAPENVLVPGLRRAGYWSAMARNVPRWLVHSDLMRGRSFRSWMRSLTKHLISIGKGAVGLKRTEKFGGGYALDRVMDLSRFPQAQRLFINRLFSAMFNYFPERYTGEVIVYEASVAPLLYQAQIGRVWREIATHCQIIEILGTHIGIIHEPYVAKLAEDLHARLQRVGSSLTH